MFLVSACARFYVIPGGPVCVMCDLVDLGTRTEHGHAGLPERDLTQTAGSELSDVRTEPPRCQAGWSRLAAVVGLLELVRGHVPDRLEYAARVVPRDPLECRELDVLDPFPRPPAVDLFRLVQPDSGLGQRVVVRIPGAPDRRLDARFGQPLGVAD